MSQSKLQIGSIGWIDLTVENAVEVKNFYSKVVGWESEPLSMGDYDDFVMKTPADEKSVSGICHAKGMNVNFPSKWLIYITVENITKSIEECNNNGGKVIIDIKNYGDMGKYCVIEDPAGAVCALFEPK